MSVLRMLFGQVTLWWLSVCWCWAVAPAGGQEEVRFRVHPINPDSQFSAAGVLDMNRDGRLDIISGAWWYEAPKFEKHLFREVAEIRGRFDDYSNLVLDVDGDGAEDVISVNYRSKSLYWCRNPNVLAPQEPMPIWKSLRIDSPGPSETGRLVDIDGDGRLDVLPNGTTFAGWYEVTAAGQWLRHELPESLVGHGIGAGDINGDGRIDVVGANGWAEGPVDPRNDRWLWHNDFRLGRDCGLPILCCDVDEDGDMDLIWGRGHNIGLYWTEQLAGTANAIDIGVDVSIDDSVLQAVASKRWLTHAIDTRWGNAHTLMLADLDGDGRDDLVTGKRFQGHDGKDPGENDPLLVAWYRFNRDTRTWRQFPVSSGGNCGIDLDSSCADLDGDGDIDIIAPSRSGLHWIENLRISGTADSQATSVASSSANPVGLSERDPMDFSFLMDGGIRRPLVSPLDHGVRRQQILTQMEAVMGSLPNSSERIPLDLRVEGREVVDGYDRLKVSFASDQSGSEVDRVPAFLLLPHKRDKPLPAMLCLHPTHFELGKSQVCGMGGQASRFYAHELAQRGFVCLAPDYPGFGEYDYDFEAHSDSYSSGTMKGIWNHMRAVDLLETLPCVDRDRIGVIGHSLGGHNALFLAAFDQRLRCVVSSCGFNAFEDYYGGDLRGWSSSRYMPRIATKYQCDPKQMPFDFPEVLAAVAPRALFVSAPIHDANFAVDGVRKCEHAVRPVYDLLGCPENFRLVYPDAEHDFPTATRNVIYDWLEDELK